MPAPIRLEVFATPEPATDPLFLAPEDLEQIRQSAYEEGYSAGWEDALTQDAQDETTRRALAEEALQALAFTQAEAQEHVLDALRPLIECMAQAVLPELARRALAPLVAEEIERFARQNLPAPLVIMCAPQTREVIVPLLAQAGALSVRIHEEASYSAGQVTLHRDAEACSLDLDAAIAAVTAAIDAYFDARSDTPDTTQETQVNG